MIKAWVLTGWQLLFGGIIMFLISQLLGERYHIGQLNGWGWYGFGGLCFLRLLDHLDYGLAV